MIIRRDYYLNELIIRMNNSLIKVITGIRRCGKSYLLNKLFYDYLINKGIKEDHIIKIALDDLENIEFHNAKKLNDFIKSKLVDNENYYLFMDEVQEVKDFVPLLNGLLKIDNLDVYITGSNSKFLSNDIITEFRGRGNQVHVSPLSFKEFYEAGNLGFDKALSDYLVYGGMPFIINRNNDQMKSDYLISLYKEIYLKDIKERYKIKNDLKMSELLDIISSSIGSLTNPTKLANTFKSVKNISISKNTIDSYLKIFEESFLVESSRRYDIKGKKYIDSPQKYYFSDLGLRNARLNFRQIEETHLMENLIYNELKMRGYLVDIGTIPFSEKNEKGNYVKKQIEVDFVVNRGSQRYYIQSAYHLIDEEKEEQEIRPLINIDDLFKKIVIVRDSIKLKRNEYGIVFMSLEDFLLNNNSLDL